MSRNGKRILKQPAGKFQLYGIFGHPLGHTLSPRMQEAGFEALGLKAFYVPLDLERFRFVRLMRRLPKLVLDGFNVTVPYKEDAARMLKKILEPEAAAVGAVNTVFKKNGHWRATNTDVFGFGLALKKKGRFNIRGAHVLVLGAGGAARAAVYALAAGGAREIVVCNRHKPRAVLLVKHFRRLFPKVCFTAEALELKAVSGCMASAGLIVNTTSAGLKPGEAPAIPRDWVPRAQGGKQKLFYDLVYRPAQTAFLKNAASRGHRTLGGAEMLFYQGARAFELWTGRRAPETAMRRALFDGLNK